jgi:hypothetical protein
VLMPGQRLQRMAAADSARELGDCFVSLHRVFSTPAMPIQASKRGYRHFHR